MNWKINTGLCVFCGLLTGGTHLMTSYPTNWTMFIITCFSTSMFMLSSGFIGQNIAMKKVSLQLANIKRAIDIRNVMEHPNSPASTPTIV